MRQVAPDSVVVVGEPYRTPASGEFVLSAPDSGTYRVRMVPFPSLHPIVAYDGPPVAISSDGFDQRIYRVPFRPPTGSDGAYFDFQIEKVARVRRSVAPRYPERLRTALLEGVVQVQFVVDTAGRAEMRSFRVLRSTDVEFTESVRQALPLYRFDPGELQGRKVRQLVQQTFTFNLSY